MHYKVMSIAVTYLASHVMPSFKLQLMNFQRYVIRYMVSCEFVKHLPPEIELLIGKKKMSDLEHKTLQIKNAARTSWPISCLHTVCSVGYRLQWEGVREE